MILNPYSLRTARESRACRRVSPHRCTGITTLGRRPADLAAASLALSLLDAQVVGRGSMSTKSTDAPQYGAHARSPRR